MALKYWFFIIKMTVILLSVWSIWYVLSYNWEADDLTHSVADALDILLVMFLGAFLFDNTRQKSFDLLKVVLPALFVLFSAIFYIESHNKELETSILSINISDFKGSSTNLKAYEESIMKHKLLNNQYLGFIQKIIFCLSSGVWAYFFIEMVTLVHLSDIFTRKKYFKA